MSESIWIEGTVDEDGKFTEKVKGQLRLAFNQFRFRNVTVIVQEGYKPVEYWRRKYFYGILIPEVVEITGFEKHEVLEAIKDKFLTDPITGEQESTKTWHDRTYAKFIQDVERWFLVDWGLDLKSITDREDYGIRFEESPNTSANES